VSDFFIVVQREGWLDWSWEVHTWIGGRPWWAKPEDHGRALTERGAKKKAERRVRDFHRERETRQEYAA
jgi:hypothetical protein